MTSHKPKRPIASSEMEARVKETFPINVDPEEFAAKDGDGWMGFIFDDYSFRDRKLDKWIHAVGSIIRDPAKLAAVQRKYLSEQQLVMIQKYMDDDLDDDADS